MPKLATRYLQSLTPRGRDYVVADSDLPRFMARVRTSGQIYFCVKYRLGARQRWVSLGRFGTVTAEQARSEALKILGDVERGIDRAGERDATREALTVRELGNRWLDQHVRRKCKPTTIAEATRLLEKIVYPALGERAARDVTRGDVMRLHADQFKRPVSGNRSLAITHAVFAYGARIGVCGEDANPARGITRYREEGRQRYLGEAELGRLGAALARAERDGTETPEAVAAIRILLLTGCRKSEILGARWKDIDFERGVLRLVDAKAGSRDVLLTAPALAVLTALPRRNEWLIAGHVRDARLVNISKPWLRIRAAAGLDDVHLHDLRHSHAAMAVAANVSLRLIGGLLGHSQDRTTARYAHLSNAPLRLAADAIGARLAAALESKPDAEARVLPFHR